MDYVWLCQLDIAKGLDIGKTCLNDKSCREFVKYIAWAETNKTLKLLDKTKFFSLTCDGSIDYMGEFLESVYIRTCNDGIVYDHFVKIGSAESASARDSFMCNTWTGQFAQWPNS